MAQTNLRLNPRVKALLIREAEKNNRSLSAEAETRLELSLQDVRTTWRDEFAKAAMQAFLTGHITYHGHERHWPYADLAVEAYEMADAMLVAREAATKAAP